MQRLVLSEEVEGLFSLLVLISRYFFVFYILFFLLQAVLYIAQESGKVYGDSMLALQRQRMILILMHATGFAILGMYPVSIQTLAFGAAGLVFLCAGLFLTDKLYPDSDPLLWNILFFFLDISLIMLCRLNWALAERQLIFMCLGLAAGLCIPLMLRFITFLDRLKYLYLALSVGLIVCTFIFGSEEYGSLNWIYIGSFGFQPSEIVKFCFLFYLACVFCKRFSLLECIFVTGASGFIVLLLVAQKDLGGALIFFMTFLLLLYMATNSMFLFLGGLAGASGAAVVAYRLFAHVRTRVAAWQNPWADIDVGGYQIAQSLFAIGTGGFLGVGLGRGMPKSIPVVEKDFIFAAICEEMGAVFGVGVILLFLLLFLRSMGVALRSTNRFYAFVAAGIVTMLAFQTFLIIGGTIKLIPLTGVTLPFISYGGSSVVVSMVMFSLLQWIGEAFAPEEEETEGEAEEA